MKLLFDENLSHRLVGALKDLYPGTAHVKDLGLSAVDDLVVWEYAREHGFAIVSKDSDFHQMSFVYGAPPKAIWIRLGNCTTADIEALLRGRRPDILGFDADSEAAFLILSR